MAADLSRRRVRNAVVLCRPRHAVQDYAVRFTEELMTIRELSNDALELAPRESLCVLAALLADQNIDGELINYTARKLGVDTDAVELIGKAYASVLNANMWYDFILDLTA